MVNRVRFSGVSDDYIVFDRSGESRLGVYYYEIGAHPRKSTVVYDRSNSTINTLSIDEMPESIYSSTQVFHVSGITLALSENIRKVAIEMIKRFQANGVKMSLDVNYRATLWDEETARNVVNEILPYLDILFISEETSRRMMQKTGTMEEIMRSYCEGTDIEVVASTSRTVISPTKHCWDSTLYSRSEDKFYSEPGYKDIEVVDRIGSGDAYLAGALFGMLKFGDYMEAVRFGNAMAAVKNTIPGDMPVSDFKEISRIISNHNSTGPVSEMNR